MDMGHVFLFALNDIGGKFKERDVLGQMFYLVRNGIFPYVDVPIEDANKNLPLGKVFEIRARKKGKCVRVSWRYAKDVIQEEFIPEEFSRRGHKKGWGYLVGRFRVKRGHWR